MTKIKYKCAVIQKGRPVITSKREQNYLTLLTPPPRRETWVEKKKGGMVPRDIVENATVNVSKPTHLLRYIPPEPRVRASTLRLRDRTVMSLRLTYLIQPRS